jgi:hypothetical protein
MAAILYPAGLPKVRLSGMTSQYQDPVIRTKMDAGPVKQRLRYTAVPKKFTGSIIVDEARRAIFDAWHKSVTGYGTLRFQMNDPKTGAPGEFRFTGIPVESDADGLTEISLPLERMQ